MRVIAIIPARYGSTRFPGKPLRRDTGKYLIQHVYEQVRQARLIDRCLVATDDERIAAAVRSFGGEAVMTRADHPSGTDRIAEVVGGLRPGEADLVVNVQGDEPEIEPAALERLVERLAADEDCPVATLACPLAGEAAAADPNCVKVVRNLQGRALYFSRSLIPYPRDRQPGGPVSASWLLHVGVYAYRRAFLLECASWAPTSLEAVEKLEQLRILEHGYPIAVELIERAAVGIDTPADYAAFVQRYEARPG
jgi:3-deoxy-manno-octulosonate cytidylyltransferase (CMP-KDO synthetase)